MIFFQLCLPAGVAVTPAYFTVHFFAQLVCYDKGE